MKMRVHPAVRLFRRYSVKGRRAVTSLEYGLIAAVVVVVGLASFSTIGTRVATKVNTVKNLLT